MSSIIIIDPRAKFNYASFYIKGFMECFGEKSLKYCITPFKSLPCNNRIEYDRGVALLLPTKTGSRKIFIDYYDKSDIDENIYSWCDYYFKVNIPLDQYIIDVNKNKLIPIGPSFGISIFSWTKLLMTFIRNFHKGRMACGIPLIRYFLDYLYVKVKRLNINYYLPTKSDKDYCFHISTLWYDKLTDSTTNYFRGKFMEISKNLFPFFEGGFYFISSSIVIDEFPEYKKYLSEYRELLSTRRIKLKEYLLKTKRSAVVFNTPSVGGCHGWKLAEYLALGKAIISTPLTNVMPGDFLHGIHYHVVSDVSELESAIKYIQDNDDYRLSLETNARKYYESYLSPERVIQRIISHAEIVQTD